MRISDWSSDVCSSDLRTEQQIVYAIGFAESHFGLLRMDVDVDRCRIEFEIDDISRMMCRVHDVGERAFQRKREQSIANQAAVDRPERRRVGKEGVRTCRSRW